MLVNGTNTKKPPKLEAFLMKNESHKSLDNLGLMVGVTSWARFPYWTTTLTITVAITIKRASLCNLERCSFVSEGHLSPKNKKTGNTIFAKTCRLLDAFVHDKCQYKAIQINHPKTTTTLRITIPISFLIRPEYSVQWDAQSASKI